MWDGCDGVGFVCGGTFIRIFDEHPFGISDLELGSLFLFVFWVESHRLPSSSLPRLSPLSQPPPQTSQLPAKYGGKYTVTLIPGDGIGAEITNSVKDIFEVLNVPVEWEQYDVSGETTGGAALFRQAMDSLKRNKVGLKGILYTPIDVGGHNSWNVAMRQQLDIYASIVLCKSLPGVPSRHKDVDFAIIRENTEGEYAGLEHQSYPGVVENLKISTRAKADRIARFAFDFALKNDRKVSGMARIFSLKIKNKKIPIWLLAELEICLVAFFSHSLSQRVTCVHKANIMKLGDGLFLNTCKAVSEEYKSSGIAFDSMIVDNT